MPYIKIAQLWRLKEIVNTATMNNASFYMNNEEKNNEIKRVTRLWRETWIISPLNHIINDIEKKEL